MDISTIVVKAITLRNSLGLPWYAYLPFLSILTGAALIYRVVFTENKGFPDYVLPAAFAVLVMTAEFAFGFNPVMSVIQSIRTDKAWIAQNGAAFNEANAWLSRPAVASPTYGDVLQTADLLGKEAVKMTELKEIQRSLQAEESIRKDQINIAEMSPADRDVLLQNFRRRQ